MSRQIRKSFSPEELEQVDKAFHDAMETGCIRISGGDQGDYMLLHCSTRDAAELQLTVFDGAQAEPLGHLSISSPSELSTAILGWMFLCGIADMPEFSAYSSPAIR